MARVEVVLDSGCYCVDTNEGRIYTGIDYHVDNGGSCSTARDKEDLKKSLEFVKKDLIDKGHNPVVVDKRTTISKSGLGNWMGDNKPKELKVKFTLMWEFNLEHKKRHYVLKWINFEEFGDMIGKKAYVFCCKWNHAGMDVDKEKEIIHEVRPMEIEIQKWLEENELNYDWEIEEEAMESYQGSEGRWEIIRRAGTWYDKLVEHCGFSSHKGFTVHSVKDVQALYKSSKNKTQCKIYLKKCTELWYENECREASENGDYIKGFTPNKDDMSAKNVVSIKNWVDKLS